MTWYLAQLALLIALIAWAMTERERRARAEEERDRLRYELLRAERYAFGARRHLQAERLEDMAASRAAVRRLN